MSALNAKLLRDLRRMTGQILAIALVVASGVAMLVMSLTAVEVLEESGRAYYERYRFAHVFAAVERAPDRLAGRIGRIPGVRTVETRIVEAAILDVAGFEEPVIGQLVSIPERGEPKLNCLALRAGRFVAYGRPDEVVIGEPFAEAHGLEPGDHLTALINGHRRRLDIVGIALSPEFVYAIGPGALMPDNRRFGVLWMGREALEAAFDLDGAFNDVSLFLGPDADTETVIDQVDDILSGYGGTGAYARADQVSHWFLANEIEQLKTMAGILPTIFLGVAAFLANMVLNRLVAVERSEIGLLKAFGYSSLAVAWHYAKLVIVITGFGIVIGWGVGLWLARVNTEMYAELFRFPFLLFRPSYQACAIGAAVSLAATLLGTAAAVRRVAVLPPAVAIQPPAPPTYRRASAGLRGLGRLLDEPTRIILRQVLRWPVRSALTAAGVGAAVAVLVLALQWLDAIDAMIDTYFFAAQRQDMTVGLVEAEPDTVLADIARLPGVMAVEPARTVSARLQAGQRSRRVGIEGVPPDAELSLVFDAEGGRVRVPPEGLVLSTKLAELLAVGPGDRVWAEVLEGRQPAVELPVVATFETYIGTPAYMDMDALSRLMREGPSVNRVHLLADEARRPALFAQLKAMPAVSSVMLRQAAVDEFHATLAETLLVYITFFVGFAGTLSFGVVYNSARIALSERGRELATLAVLGFTRVEIAYILLGEIALLIAIGLPLGCLMGAGLSWMMAASFDTELYRVPLVVNPSTYGFAVATTLVATVLSGASAWRWIKRLDLVGVLKTRE